MKQVIGFALQSARSAHHGDAAKLAEGETDRLSAWDGQIVAVEVNLARDTEVEAAIAVKVAPRSTR